jgi:hypothetical protein
MGNGRKLGIRGEKWLGLKSMRALSAAFMLLAVAAVLLVLTSRHAQFGMAQVPTPRLSNSSRPFLRPASHAQPSAQPDARNLLGQLPMIFEPNQGQADAPVKFLARGAGYGLFLEPTGFSLSLQNVQPLSSAGHQSSSRKSSLSASSLRTSSVTMKLVGANAAAPLAGANLLPGKSNYLLGNDAQKWRSGIAQYGEVRYTGVYRGIDLVFYGNQGQLEYDFKVAPGADAAQAEMQFEGADKLALRDGDLILTGAHQGELRLQAPRIYQLDPGQLDPGQGDGKRRQPVAGHFVLRPGNRVGFAIGAYDHSRELVIDPILKFSSYFAGTGAVTYPTVAVNGDGYIYVTGSTTSSAGFPVGGTVPTTIGTGTDVFVAKINPSQPPSVVYLTFLGGSGTDNSIGIGVDNSAQTYIVGNTTSANFPTSTTGYQPLPTAKGTQCPTSTGPCTSVFVSQLNSAGSALNYSSYLSGTGDDVASGMAIDLAGDIFVTGTTTSTTSADVPSPSVAFPATNLPVPYQSLPLSSIQFFATKVNTNLPSVSSIAYSTLFGGSTPSSPIAVGGGIAVDTNGNMYFSGTTNFYNSGQGEYGDGIPGTDFPILNAYQPCLDTVPPTVLANPNPCSAANLGSTYPSDAFVAKINPNAAAGTQLLFSTYFGGAATDTSTGVAVNTGATSIFITGQTNSSDFVFPTGSGTYQECLDTPPPNVLPCPVIAAPAPFDAYVAEFGNPTASTTGSPVDVPLNYFTYLGGSGNDNGLAITVDSSSDALVTGSTTSPNFPVTTGPIQSSLNGAQNAFFAEINPTTITGQTNGTYVTYFGGNGVDRGTGIAVDPAENTYFVGDTTSTNLQVVNALPYAGGNTFTGSSDAFIVKLGTANFLTITNPVVSPAGIASAGNQVTITYTVTNEGPDPATNLTVTGLIGSGSATFFSASVGSGTCTTTSGAQAACQIPTLQSGSSSTVTFVVVPTSVGTYQVTATVSDNNNINTSNTSTANFTTGGFNIQMNPTAQTVVAGDQATYNVTLSPNPVFGSPVALTCGAVPTGAKCNFTSSTVNFGDGTSSQSSTLNLTTTPQPVPIASSRTGRTSLYALWLMVPGLAVVGLGASGKRRRGKVLGGLAVFMLFALVFLQPSCSSAKQQPPVAGTPTGTYSLTVTASSGSYTKTVPFSLTVTP